MYSSNRDVGIYQIYQIYMLKNIFSFLRCKISFEECKRFVLQ